MGKNRYLIFVLSLVILFAFVQVAGACVAIIPIPNRFISTDGNSSAMSFSGNGGLASEWYFGVYDSNAGTDGKKLLYGGDSGNSPVYGASFEVSGDSTTGYTLSLLSGVDSGEIDLGDSPDFAFYFLYGTTYYTGLMISQLEENRSYAFNTDSSGLTFGNDISPVPLPPSALFLFSGLLGLVAFARRRNIVK